MNEERALTTQPGPGLLAAPREVVAAAREQATVLMEIVEDKKLYQAIGGKKYLEAEAWETILAFNSVHPVTRSVTPIIEEGKVTGYLAHVDLMKGGEVVSSGILPCGFDDFPCRGKDGTAKHKAAMSAAQTWALSKAARMKFAWVVVLAGYAPTPADEMIRQVQAQRQQDTRSRKPLAEQAAEIAAAKAAPPLDALTAQFKAACEEKGLDGHGAAQWLREHNYVPWSQLADDGKAQAIAEMQEPFNDPQLILKGDSGPTSDDPRGDPEQLTEKERRLL